MEDWNKKLIEAAEKGSVEELKLCLANRANIDYQYSGWTALMWAALNGHVEVCQLLLENRCNKDITDAGGWTALMLAASRGHVEVSRLLLENKCKKDIRDVGGWTALMFAAFGGHVEVSRLLLENRCNKDITDIAGKTALHLAAEWGHLQVTRCLVEEGGISPFVKTHEGKTPYDLAATGFYGPNKKVMEYLQGKTPYDLAASRKWGRYKEVMEYLQTVMSEKSSGVTAGLVIEDEVPTEIKLMTDKRSVELYLKLLESGSEKKRDIRLVVVGKKGAGKTSLIKRLFGEDITDVTSTNGIEIHKIKCKAKSDDGIWNKLDGNNEETETQARLLKEYEGKLQDKGTVEIPVESHIAINDNTPSTSFDVSKKSGTVYQQPEIIKSQEAGDPPVTNQQPDKSLEQAGRDYETMQTAKSKVDLTDKEEYATLLLWDFAGDEEFYHTHQTFLSPDAIYFVVTKLNEADDPSAKDLFRLWIDSIHCYCRPEQDKNEADDNKSPNCIDPPVVVIGTWKDAVICEIEELEDACIKNLWQYTENLAEDERGHIRSKHFISNKKDDNHVFLQIRQDILNLARSMRTWNTDYPLKFIQLEQCLQEKKKELPIISYQEIMHMAAATPKPLSVEELRLFLDFHHEIRALVYFKDLPDYIILDTQWLSNSFKCIVTAKKFRAANIRNQKRWEEFYQRGKLHNDVLEDIFKIEQNILYKHKDHVLNVMEKFDIIIRPNISGKDTADAKPCFYVPCMIKEEPECDIYKMFNVTKDICKKSTWLNFKFRFLPPHLINHLIASLSRKYEVAEFATKQHKKQIALFRGSGVFELQKATQLRKLLVMKCPNAIQIQVWQFGKQVVRGMYKYIADFVLEEITEIISTRFKMSNVKFEKKWECGLTKPESVTGTFDFSEEQEKIYYCKTCSTVHEFIGEWSDLQQSSSDISANVPRSTPSIASFSQNKTPVQSTKVCVRIKSGNKVFVHDEAPGTASSAGFTVEQINFTKMGIIVLNVLADASYDLLKQDIPNLRPRSDCDITYLYQEHRKLRKHTPTNGWGGEWQKIQVANIAIGDDIERIRLTRNELQHSKAAGLGDTRFNELMNILSDLLKRFDQHNKPAKLYTDHINEIAAKTVSAHEVQSIENGILGMDIAVEIETK